MAAKNYVELTDITYKSIKNAIALVTAQGGDLSEYNTLLLETNDYYEDLADQIDHIDPADLVFPIPLIAKNLLNYYFTYRYAEENADQIHGDFGDVDPKILMGERAYERYTDCLKAMNKPYITGTVEDRGDRSVSFGNMERA
jgi:serine/threonine-protein kinase RIO1